MGFDFWSCFYRNSRGRVFFNSGFFRLGYRLDRCVVF